MKPTAQRYRKKPVIIEAWELTSINAPEIAKWCKGSVDPVGRGIKIPTLEGTMFANTGDFIIKGVQGEFYPCKPDIFNATYEQVLGEAHE